MGEAPLRSVPWVLVLPLHGEDWLAFPVHRSFFLKKSLIIVCVPVHALMPCHMYGG